MYGWRGRIGLLVPAVNTVVRASARVIAWLLRQFAGHCDHNVSINLTRNKCLGKWRDIRTDYVLGTRMLAACNTPVTSAARAGARVSSSQSARSTISRGTKWNRLSSRTHCLWIPVFAPLGLSGD